MAIQLNNYADDYYIPLEDLDWRWTKQEVEAFRHMWNTGYSPEKIAKYLNREDPDEVIVIALCQLRKGAIEKRPGGMKGTIE
ncbi:hypothetical protein [Halalkalibacterium ligniniphilum]|uniref:hypothetical protein n=1 Tax=Halalkalibacterium ligniniphilum TaxID=1134413 RepID=UPI000344E1F5|nr:hypothetical protein [Halalkalibacterium ligniniphilum]